MGELSEFYVKQLSPIPSGLMIAPGKATLSQPLAGSFRLCTVSTRELLVRGAQDRRLIQAAGADQDGSSWQVGTGWTDPIEKATIDGARGGHRSGDAGDLRETANGRGEPAPGPE